MKYKYNFLLMYAKMEAVGIPRSFIRKNLSRDMGIIPATLRRWEKIPLEDDKTWLAKSHIVYCANYFRCEIDEFANRFETTTYLAVA